MATFETETRYIANSKLPNGRVVKNAYSQGTRSDFFTISDTKECPADEFTPIAFMKIPSNQVRTFGSSGFIGNNDNRGIVEFDLKDDSNASIDCDIQVVAFDSEKRGNNPFGTAFDSSDVAYDGGRSQAKVSENSLLVREDSYIAVMVRPIETKTFSKANSKFKIPITYYELY